MAIRFRKSFKLAPGVRMNLSGSGLSATFGPRGASVSVGKRGVHGNVGLPGTGLSMRQKLSGTQSRARLPAPNMVAIPLTVGVGDDGVLFFHDAAGDPIPEHLVATAKKQQGEAIKGLIQRKCDEINAQIEAIGDLHLATPDPAQRPTYVAQEYSEPRPVPPTPKVLGFLDKLFASRRTRIEADNRAAMLHHEQDVSAWDASLTVHREAETKRRRLIEELIYRDPDAMEQHLEQTLQTIDWPRETLVAAEIVDGGRVVFLDVDLPEIEDMPDRTAGVPQRGMKLSVKTMSPTQVRRLYMRHVHAVGFRIIGETFAALPKVDQVVLSGFSQRRDLATGQLGDEYLYSVCVERSDWYRIDFAGLGSIDVVDALSRFDLRRDMTKTGLFKPIAPFAIS